jgi:hypothetical protein
LKLGEKNGSGYEDPEAWTMDASNDRRGAEGGNRKCRGQP